MGITLEQAKVGMADKVTQSVIDTFQRASFILDHLTFDDAVAPGTGGSTMTYGYTQIKTPSVAAGRAINSEYTPGEAIKEKKTTDVKVFGGSFQVDRVLEKTAAASELAFQAEQKTKATANKFHNDFINGDSSSQPLDFDGLDKLITGSDTEYNPQTAIDVSDLTKIETNGKQLVFALHETIRMMDGKPDALLMNGRTLSVLTMVASDMGYITHAENKFGQSVTNFDGIPMIDMGMYYNGTKSVDVVEIGASTGLTSIYAVSFGLDALHGVSPTGSKVVSTYMPNLNEPGAVKTGEVEMLATIALKNSKKAAALRNIKVQATA